MNTQVEVKSNSLRAEGMIAIAEALKVNSTVTNIDVSDNEIGGWYSGPSYNRTFHPTPKGPAGLEGQHHCAVGRCTLQWVEQRMRRSVHSLRVSATCRVFQRHSSPGHQRQLSHSDRAVRHHSERQARELRSCRSFASSGSEYIGDIGTR